MTDAEVQQALQALSQLGAAATNSRANIQNVGQSMVRLRMEMQRGTGTVQSNTAALQRLQSDFDSLDTQTKKSAAGQAMLAEQTKMAGDIMRNAVGNLSASFLKGGLTEAIDYFRNQIVTSIGSYQEGVSGTTAVLRQQSAAIDSQIKILDRLSTGATVAAEMLALIPSPAARIGAMFSAGVAAGSGFFKAQKELEKQGYGALMTEVSKTTIAYQTLTKQGLAAATLSMIDLREGAAELHLDLNELTGVVTRNKDSLIELGGSLAGGVVRLRDINTGFNVLAKQGRDLRGELYRIGISYEDQADHMVEYMRIQQTAGTLASKSQTQLAEESARYMTNLKAISSITGEDVKSAQKRAQEASEQLAVQAKLRKSQDPQAFEKFQAMVKVMPKDMQKGIQQMVAFDGTVVDKSLNILFSQSPTRKKMMDEAYQDLLSGMDQTQIVARQEERMKKYGPMLEKEGLAMGESLGVANLANESYAEVVRLAQNQVREGQKGQASFVDTLGTTATALEAMKKGGIDPVTDAFMQLDIQQRKLIMPEMMTAFNKVIEQLATQGTKDGAIPTLAAQQIQTQKETLVALKALGFVVQIPPALQTVSSVVTDAATTNQRAASGLIDVSRNFLTSSTTIERAAGKFETAVGKLSGAPRAQTGAILEGPNSGFFAQLHGTEAVIPLGDGNSVNVAFKNPAGVLGNMAAKENINTGSLEKSIGDIFNSPNLMINSITELKNLISTDSQMSQSLMKQYTEKMDSLIEAMNNNVDYSKRIADNIA